MAAKDKFVIDPIDGLPAMIVGRWVSDEKHKIVRRYIHASYRARKKYGASSYIDLFSGSGRVKIRHVNRFEDGGPLAAWNMARSNPGEFTHFYIADAEPQYLEACQIRLIKAGAPCTFFHGVADETVDRVINTIPKGALHLAFLDPYNIGHLHFSIIEKLSKLQRVDIAVHLSTSDIRRNLEMRLDSRHTVLDNVAPGWRSAISRHTSKKTMAQHFIEYWESLVRQTGLRVCESKYSVTNDGNVPMYHLYMLTRSDLAERLWSDACKINPTRPLF